MKLFYLPGACSRAPHIVLNEIGQKYELEKMDKADRTSILRYNPKGLVPTLILDDGQVLTESAVILQYLADLKPESNLIPKAGTWQRYKCQEWLNYVATEIHKGIGIFFNPAFDDNARAIFKAAIEKKLSWLDEHFAKNEYLMGSQITVADFYAFVTIGWTRAVNIDISSKKNLTAFLERIKSRPAVIKAIELEK